MFAVVWWWPVLASLFCVLVCGVVWWNFLALAGKSYITFGEADDTISPPKCWGTMGMVSGGRGVPKEKFKNEN